MFLIKFLFPNWKTVKVSQGTWNPVRPNNIDTQKVSIYEFQYSDRLNKYRLKISGFKPKEHYGYIQAVSELRVLQNETISKHQ